MNKRVSSILYFLIVLIPYLVLLAVTAYSYPLSPEEFAFGLPKILIWVPAVISSILPITYGILVFGFREHLKSILGLLVGFFMAIALLSLSGVVYLITV